VALCTKGGAECKRHVDKAQRREHEGKRCSIKKTVPLVSYKEVQSLYSIGQREPCAFKNEIS
jgi:hypothetical protein